MGHGAVKQFKGLVVRRFLAVFFASISIDFIVIFTWAKFLMNGAYGFLATTPFQRTSICFG